MFFISNALFPFLPGQTSTQVPHPVQSNADTAMVNFIPGIPVISMDCISCGALLASSSVSAIGRIVACGHTNAQRLH